MVLKLLKFFSQTSKKAIYTYFGILLTLISFAYFQYQLYNNQTHNFWIWLLYLDSDLYTAIVGLPLLYLFGCYLISQQFFQNPLIILRLKNRQTVFLVKLASQLLFLGIFLLSISVIGILISCLGAHYDLSWTVANKKSYLLLFSQNPLQHIPLLYQVMITHSDFSAYLLFLMNAYNLCQTLFKSKAALILSIISVIGQVFCFKMALNMPFMEIFPIQHYQVSHVGNVIGNSCYWILSNAFLVILTYFLSLKRETF